MKYKYNQPIRHSVWPVVVIWAVALGLWIIITRYIP